MWIILLSYLVLLILVSLISFRQGFQNIFRTSRKLPWILAGFSLFMLNQDTINILPKMGIVSSEGYAGMWIYYSGVLGAGFLPIIFAPLWNRLNFMTDNQFILLRFGGKAAKILHFFRAAYVGYLVCALMIAQVFIGISKLLMVFFELDYLQSYLVIALLLTILILKNTLQVKVRTDFLNGIIYLTGFAIGAYFVVRHSGGTGEMYSVLRSEYGDYIRLVPAGGIKDTTFETLPTFFVYILIQWWSIQVLDGGGPEAQRFMNVKTPFRAFQAAFLPLLLFSLVFLFHSFVLDAGILTILDTSYQAPFVRGEPDMEAAFYSLYRLSMPGKLEGLIFLAFIVAFISILEALINWGASFVTVDIFKTYVLPGRSDPFYSRLSYAAMAAIGITGVLIAWYNTHLLGLQKFLFSMAAGVGPVFILRWFWWRINAWSQFSAMLSSLILATSWDRFYFHHPAFKKLIIRCHEYLNLSPYAFKLLCLTILVSVIWILVTFLTSPDKPETLRRFTSTVKPGGWWKQYSKGRLLPNPGKVMLLIIYPFISILPFLIIWTFKFGSAWLALVSLVLWVFLLFFTVKKMR